jgi:hypothetical protein
VLTTGQIDLRRDMHGAFRPKKRFTRTTLVLRSVNTVAELLAPSSDKVWWDRHPACHVFGKKPAHMGIYLIDKQDESVSKLIVRFKSCHD